MPSNANSIWTEERIATLKRYWDDDGYSCSQIAAEMGCGITRNAVIGKVHRLGLPLRGKMKPSGAPKKPRAPRKKTSRIVWANGNSDKLRLIDYPIIECGPVRSVDVVPRNVSLMDLQPADCRYPYGEGEAITFCGHPKLDGSSYCGPHFVLTRMRPRTNSDAVTYARARRMRGINFRRQLLEGAA